MSLYLKGVPSFRYSVNSFLLNCSQLRYFTTRRKPSRRLGKLVTTRSSKKLEAPEQSKSARKIFAFGNFAGLQQPSLKTVEINSKAIESIKSFDALRIFPTVRLAMLEEIKDGYNLKSTYITDKESLEIKPTLVQIAAIRKINKSRVSNSDAKKKEKQLTTGEAIVNELMKTNESNKLKVFTIAAETGSGKTWAYLAPLLSKLKEKDLEFFRKGPKEYELFKKSPIVRSVILLPTHELVEQVYECLDRTTRLQYDLNSVLSAKVEKDPQYLEFLNLPENRNSLQLNVLKWGAGDPHTKLLDAVNNRVDILVTTPAKIMGLAKLTNFNRPFKFFSHVEHCIIDEADTLLDKSWIVDTTSVIRKLPKCKDLIFASATIPKEFNKTIKKMFPDEHSIINIVTPSLHKIPKQIVLKVIDAQLPPYNGSKTRCLAQAIYAIHNDGTEEGYVKRILIFVNEKKDVQPLCDALVEKYGHREEDIIGVTGADLPDDRLIKLEQFLKPAQLLGDDLDDSKIKVLVTTDLLARGLNFVGIKNVILMDLPNTSVDLVHRVGRTGRMRQSGRVFVIIDKKTKKSWIKGLPNAIKRGVTLG